MWHCSCVLRSRWNGDLPTWMEEFQALGRERAEEAKWFQGLSPGGVGRNTGVIDRRWVDLANRGSLWYQEWAAFMENEEA